MSRMQVDLWDAERAVALLRMRRVMQEQASTMSRAQSWTASPLRGDNVPQPSCCDGPEGQLKNTSALTTQAAASLSRTHRGAPSSVPTSHRLPPALGTPAFSESRVSRHANLCLNMHRPRVARTKFRTPSRATPRTPVMGGPSGTSPRPRGAEGASSRAAPCLGTTHRRAPELTTALEQADLIAAVRLTDRALDAARHNAKAAVMSLKAENRHWDRVRAEVRNALAR